MKIVLISLLFSSVTFASNRLKDVVTIKGVRENPLIGYGLVIGLNGTGDGGGEITNNSMKKMFQTLGLDPVSEVSSSNVAAVIVTTKLPPFGRLGQKLDITVSSIGGAKSLAGGTLLVTPLKGGDGKIYAVASGALSIGGLTQGAKFATSGVIPNGGTVERELELMFNDKKSLRLSLNRPDFTTIARIVKLINQTLGGKFADASDAGTVNIIIPPNYQRNVVNLIATLENIEVISDQTAKIVINEKTGTIVAGGDITLRAVAISHGDLVVEVGNKENSNSGKKQLHFMENKSTLKELVESLNALGTGPDDLISILQTLKRNGALTADLEFI